MTDTTISISIDEEEQHREFLLVALRAATVRARLIQADLETVGVALKAGLIGSETAVAWIREAGLLWMVGALPERVGRVASQNGEVADAAG